MTILRNVEIHYLKANPSRPNAKFDAERPTWEVQLRTRNKQQADEWKSIGLSVKKIAPEEEGVAPFWRANLKKKSVKDDGTKASPVTVVNGSRQDIDPDTVGNGSIAHIRIFQYEFPKKPSGTGIANVLMGLQIVKHLVYTPKPHNEDFGDEETEVVVPEGDTSDETPAQASPSPSPKVGAPTADNLPDADF